MRPPALLQLQLPPAAADALLCAGDQCGEMLVGAGMGGMGGMSIFYDHCLETLYPPGMCVSAQPLARTLTSPEK